MQIPEVILGDIYSLLCEYDEKPQMNKELFIEWYSRGWIYVYNIVLNTLVFHCTEPFFCQVKPNLHLPIGAEDQSKIDKLNEALSELSDRYRKMILFW